MHKALFKKIAFVLLATPALWLGWQMYHWFSFLPHELTANPQKFITQYTGLWAIRILIVTLCLSPLSWAGWRSALSYRRMAGLYAAFYTMLHLLNYFILDYGLDMAVITKDILKRPAISIGAIAAVIMMILSITSTQAMMWRLGRLWRRLHRMIYGLAILVPVHGFLMVKGDRMELSLYGMILAGLLLMRLWRFCAGRYRLMGNRP